MKPVRRMIKTKLLDAPPEPKEFWQVMKDLLYCLQQSLAFLHYKFECLTDEERGQIVQSLSSKQSPPRHLTQHNAALESSLINIRCMSEFFERKKIKRVPGGRRNADINFYDLFHKYPPALLTEKQKRDISQLFLHLTANRNIRRNPKKDWPLASLLEKVVKTFRWMQNTNEFRAFYAPFSANSMTNEYSLAQEINNTLVRAENLIEKEKAYASTTLNQPLVIFNRSGGNEFHSL